MHNSHGNLGTPSLRLVKNRQHCDQCDTLELCTHAWLDDELIECIDPITLDCGIYQAGQPIFQMEDRFRALYIVQSGLVKVEKILENGTNHVSGFYFRGDLFGLKSIGRAEYGYDAIALETTRVCEIPYQRLAALGLSIPRLQQKMINLLGSELHQLDDLLVDGRHLNAEKRLLLFLRNLCERNRIQSRNNTGRLHLPMTKTDIASYLGIRPESVSRALTNLHRQGVIRNHPKYIEIDDVNLAEHSLCR